uniref:Ovule protein n=1 Tax=Heterorhabditis bacteriophora TaxID=37862 RepID=A0A1I7W7Z1_HETBA
MHLNEKAIMITVQEYALFVSPLKNYTSSSPDNSKIYSLLGLKLFGCIDLSAQLTKAQYLLTKLSGSGSIRSRGQVHHAEPTKDSTGMKFV